MCGIYYAVPYILLSAYVIITHTYIHIYNYISYKTIYIYMRTRFMFTVHVYITPNFVGSFSAVSFDHVGSIPISGNPTVAQLP